MQSLFKLEQLEVDAFNQPNSIQVNQALAEEYVKEKRWEDAINAYKTVVALYPTVAELNVNRIRLGATALVISSLLFLTSEILRPPIILVDNLINVAEYMSSPALAISNALFLPILILLSCAAISIYKLLSISSDNRLAFWAMVSIITGAGLFLPFFGISAVVLPAAGQLYFQGNIYALSVYLYALQQPLAIVFTLGGYLLLVGLTLFNIVAWKSGYLPKWASTLFWIGWSLYITTLVELPFNFIAGVLLIPNPMFLAVLVAIGGIGLAVGTWKQASFQIGPMVDSSKKVDS